MPHIPCNGPECSVCALIAHTKPGRLDVIQQGWQVTGMGWGVRAEWGVMRAALRPLLDFEHPEKNGWDWSCNNIAWGAVQELANVDSSFRPYLDHRHLRGHLTEEGVIQFLHRLGAELLRKAGSE